MLSEIELVELVEWAKRWERESGACPFVPDEQQHPRRHVDIVNAELERRGLQSRWVPIDDDD